MSVLISLVKSFSSTSVFDRIQEDFVAINKTLQKQGLPAHMETVDSGEENLKFPEVCWRYSSIHYLRYLAAKFIENPLWVPDKASANKSKIPARLCKQICEEKQSHLICHSDFDGYYLPIDFELIIFDREVGVCLGSSVQLHKELEDLAKKLNLDLGDYTPDLEELFKVREREFKKDFLGTHKWLLLCLYNIATASILYESAIRFT